MRNIGLKIFIFIYILIISIPLILVNLRIKVDPITPNEKKISMNFKRNFPLKSDLFNVYSTIKTDVFGANPLQEKAIDIKNGWKFLGNSFSNALSESKGLVVFSPSELKILKKKLEDRQQWLSERNIKFYLAVAPNKHSIYGDMIPIKKYNRNTKMEQLDSLCQTINVPFINLGSQYPDKDDIRLYHKTDSHWNDYAGYFGYKSTMDIISKDFPRTRFKPFSLDDLEMKIINEPIGDLNEMLQLKKSEDFIHLNFKNPPQAIQEANILDIPFGYYKDPSFYETRYKNPINDLKILIFNDSFFGYYGKYLSENFGNSVFIWNYKFDKDLISSEKPDILYHQIVERDVDFLLED
jgi:hypothetical protein